MKAILSKSQQRPAFYVQSGAMAENKYGVPPETIAEMERTLPMETIAQAVYGMFVDASGLVFSNEMLINMFQGDPIRTEKWLAPEVDFRMGLRSEYKHMKGANRRKFIASADLARQVDYTVITVWDATQCPDSYAQLVYYHRLNRVSWDTIFSAIAGVSARFQTEVLLDSTGSGGDVVLDELEGRFFCEHCDAAVPFTLSGGSIICPKCHQQGHRVNVAGHNFAGKRKEQLITRLQQALSYAQAIRPEWGLLRMPRIEQVSSELVFYRLDDKGLSTDTVMALALAAEQLEFEESGSAVGSLNGG